MASIDMAFGLLIAGGGLAATAMAYRGGRRQEGVLAYLRETADEEAWTTESGPAHFDASIVERVLRPALHGFTERMRSLFPSSYLDSVHTKILRAGLSNKIRAEEFVTVQVVAAVASLVLGLTVAVLGHSSLKLRILLFFVLGLVGCVGPRAWLTGRADRRSGQIAKELPDVLDLLTISVEAGLGLEAAMESVCHDLDSPLGHEISRTLQEMNLGLSRGQALENLKNRNDVEDLSTFILVLTQADVLGMPIGRVLRTQADEMRDRRRGRAREKAAKLPVKILFPLMMFILPALMVVVMGPAAINAMHSFSHMHSGS